MKKSEPKPTRARMRTFTEKLLNNEVQHLRARVAATTRAIAYYERSGTVVDGVFCVYAYAKKQLPIERALRTRRQKQLALAQASLDAFKEGRLG